MAGFASADPITHDSTDKSGTAKVTLSLHNIYSVTLPADISLNYNEEEDAFTGSSHFSVEIQRISSSEVLNVTVSGNVQDNKWCLVESTSGDTIPYELGVGSSTHHIGHANNRPITPSAPLLVENTKTTIPTTYLHAKVSESDTGDHLDNLVYSDTLTFTVNVGPGTVSTS